MNTLAKRLAQAREQKGLNQSELARALGLSPQAVQNWESGKSSPRGSRLAEVASMLGVTAEHLITGRILENAHREVKATPPYTFNYWNNKAFQDEGDVIIPFLEEVELLPRRNGATVVAERPRGLRFSRAVLHSRHVLPDDALCFTVHGNSMEPLLPDGSTVAIDKGNTNIIDGKLYAINHDYLLRVKILYRMPGGGLRMRSYNSAEHPDEEYTSTEIREQSIEILGRVFWYSVVI